MGVIKVALLPIGMTGDCVPLGLLVATVARVWLPLAGPLLPVASALPAGSLEPVASPPPTAPPPIPPLEICVAVLSCGFVLPPAPPALPGVT